jgi:hypothetical protein
LSMTVKICMTLIIVFFSCVALSAEEYWTDYFHFTSKEQFDEGPQMFSRLEEDAAYSKGSFTVVSRDDKGRVIEAVSMLQNKPNYYYLYVYDNDYIIYRGMFVFLGEDEQLISEVIYARDESGKPISTAYYKYDLFGKKSLAFTKVYQGENYIVYDNRPPERDTSVLDELEKIGEELKELQQLEKRGLIKRIFGWE